MSSWDAFQSLLSQLSHEDDLLIGRTMWLVNGETLLLIAYILIKNERPRINQSKSVSYQILFIGLVSSIIVLTSILASITVYVGIRERLHFLVIQHPDLPFRHLPNSGIGTGLLAPLLLAMLSFASWAFMITSSWVAVMSGVVSATLLIIYFVGEAHGPRAGSPEASIITASLPMGLLALVFAVLVGT